MNKSLFAILASTLVLTACSSTPKPTYVSPVQYQEMSCQALQAEYNRIHEYIQGGVTPAKRTGVGVGIGLGGGWGSRGGWGIGPSISVNMGQSGPSKKSEVERVLGEQEAIVKAASYKQCPILVRSNKITAINK
jgi:hypothetical protein